MPLLTNTFVVTGRSQFYFLYHCGDLVVSSTRHESELSTDENPQEYGRAFCKSEAHLEAVCIYYMRIVLVVVDERIS